MNTQTIRTMLSRRGALVICLGAVAMIPSSASAYYGAATEQGTDRKAAATETRLVIPDHAALNESLAPVSGSPGARGVEGPKTPPFAASASSGDGFDWADAAVGAGAVLALVAMGGAALVTMRRRTTVSPSASTS